MTKKHEDFSELSYNLHKKHLSRYLKDKKLYKFSKSWLRNDTVDYWRHKRMYEQLGPLIKFYPDAKWLTVGDGKYGRDAQFIQAKGVEVLATDISDFLLKEAKEIGFIKKYKKENAEKLSFKDKKFDFVLCKESFHHFPKPIVALYEMIRVSKKGVVLIEPNDVKERIALIKKAEIFIKRLLGHASTVEKYFDKFEESGNYVYSFSRREAEKVARAIGLKCVAFKGFDDYYVKGVENEKVSNRSKLFLKIKILLLLMEIAYRLSLRERSLLTAVIFKENVSQELRSKMENIGFEVVNLPENPYV